MEKKELNLKKSVGSLPKNKKTMLIVVMILGILIISAGAIITAFTIWKNKQVAPEAGYAGNVGEPCRGEGFIKSGECLKCLSGKGFRSQLFCESKRIIDLPQADSSCDFLCSYTVCQSWGYKEDFYCQAKNTTCPADDGLCCLDETETPLLCYRDGICIDTQICDASANQPPLCQRITKNPDITTISSQGGQILLTAEATDPNNDNIFYEWHGTGLGGNTKEVIWEIEANPQIQAKTLNAWVYVSDGINQKQGGEGTSCSTQLIVEGVETDFTAVCEQMSYANTSRPESNPKTGDTISLTCMAKTTQKETGEEGPEVKKIKFIIYKDSQEITQLETLSVTKNEVGLYKGTVEYILGESGAYRIKALVCTDSVNDNLCQ